MIKNIKFTAIILIQVATLLTVSKINAQENTPNISNEKYNLSSDISREIENILLFNNDEQERINAISGVRKKDMFEIKNSVAASESNLNFETSKPNVIMNLDIKAKEKIAYNAYLSGQYEVAIELYKQIVAVEPYNNYANYSLALLYQKMGQFDDAKILYRQLLKNGAQNREEIIANMMTIIAQESPRDAIYMLSRLSSQHPNSAYLLAQTGLVYNKIKDYAQAINYLERAAKQDPSRLDYKYNLAIMYDKNKDYEKAVETYFDVVKNYGSDEKWEKIIPINQVKSRLDQVRSMI